MSLLLRVAVVALLSCPSSAVNGVLPSESDVPDPERVRVKGEVSGTEPSWALDAFEALDQEQAAEKKARGGATVSTSSDAPVPVASGPTLGVPVESTGDHWVPVQRGGLCVLEASEATECLTLPEGRWEPLPEEGSPSPESDDTQEPQEGSEPIFITITQSEFAELPLQAPPVHVQPDQDWVLVNIDTIAYTSDAPQILETELLGVPVAVRATPIEFSWDFGDGSDPIVTTGPGRPYPHQTIGYSYTQAAEQRVVTLTTTWSGEFQVAGQGPWIPIAGTVTTTSQSDPFAVETRHARLVGAQS